MNLPAESYSQGRQEAGRVPTLEIGAVHPKIFENSASESDVI